MMPAAHDMAAAFTLCAHHYRELERENERRGGWRARQMAREYGRQAGAAEDQAGLLVELLKSQAQPKV